MISIEECLEQYRTENLTVWERHLKEMRRASDAEAAKLSDALYREQIAELRARFSQIARAEDECGQRVIRDAFTEATKGQI